MKKKSNYRTPKRLLSLFLCVLMVVGFMPYCAVQNKAEAFSGTGQYYYRNYIGSTYAQDDFGFTVYGATSTSFNSQIAHMTGSFTGSYVIYSYYDFRSGANNSTFYTDFTEYKRYYVGSNGSGDGYSYSTSNGGKEFYPTLPDYADSDNGTCSHSYVSYKATKDANNEHCTISKDKMPSNYYYYTYKYNEGYTYNESYSIGINFFYYGINTTELYYIYQDYKTDLGLAKSTDIYTEASWKNYLKAMATAKDRIDGKESGIISQTTVNQWEAELDQAVADLEYLSTEVPLNIYSSGPGYGYSNRPDKVNYYSNLEFDVDLYEGYTQSVPTVTVNGKTYNGTKKDADTYHFVIPIARTVDRIVVNNVKKNTYTVTVPSSGTGFTASKSGTVTHGENYTFTVKLLDGYTQTLPTVKAGTVTLGATPIGNNTYSYTITGVKADTSVSINGVAANTYSVGYSLGAGVSKASGTATSIKHFGTATVKLTVDPAYSQRTPAPTVTNGTLSTGTRNGNTFTYTLSGVTANTTVTVPALALNQYTVTIPKGTGYSLDATSKDVTHGDTTTFTVTLDSAHNQNAPVAKIDGKALTYTKNGDSYTFKTDAITDFETVEIGNIKTNTYNIGYNCGAGTSAASGTATTIQHGGNATVKITVAPEYSQRTPAPTVTNGKLTYVSKSGTTYTYTLSGVTAHTTVNVPGLALNQYTVTIPEGTGYSLDATSKTVTHGNTTSFTVTLDSAHNQNAPVAKIDGKELSYTKDGDKYTFTTGAITDFKTVEIGNVQINKYQYTLPTGAGFTVANATGMDCTSITHGKDYSFTVTVDKAYTQTVPTVTLKDGTVLTADSAEFVGGDEKGDKVYTYTVKNVTDHNKISVAAMSKNTYSAVLPYDKTAEASYKVTNGKADGNNVVSGIVYGTDLTFGVALDAQYNRSTVVVKYKGDTLTPDESGHYTIENITQDITEGDIVVEGVELNHYYITLPLETETGFVIEVGEGLNAKSVLSRTDFNFKFFLDPAYSDSNPDNQGQQRRWRPL